MRADVAEKLDAAALAELAAERERNGRTVAALSHTDSAGLAAECDRHVVNVNRIMSAFMGRLHPVEARGGERLQHPGNSC